MDIEQQAARPRLRTRHLLFGLVAATSAAQVVTHYALCDHHGAPACGNIGQRGSVLPPPTPISIALPAPPDSTVVMHTAPLVNISITQTLVAPPPPKPPKTEAVQVVRDPEVLPVGRPLVDRDDYPMNGNAMSKGGRRGR